MKKHLIALIIALCTVALHVGSVHAQENGYSLQLRRNWGTGLGNRIQGSFTLRLSGDEAAVQSVIYTLDGQEIARIEQSPFLFSFDTDSYTTGPHSLGAEIYLRNGQTESTPTIQIVFMGADENRKAIASILVPILVITLGATLLSILVQSAGARKASQNKGQTAIPRPSICTHCGKPFSRPVLGGINLLQGKYMPCPHCRKWQIARPASPEAVQTAWESIKTADLKPQAIDENEAIRQAIDDSKYLEDI